jgi:hypothetical protein
MPNAAGRVCLYMSPAIYAKYRVNLIASFSVRWPQNVEKSLDTCGRFVAKITAVGKTQDLGKLGESQPLLTLYRI